MKVTFRTLNRKGDEPTICDTPTDIERKFTAFMSKGYAAFYREEQVRSFADIQRLALTPGQAVQMVTEMEIVMVPSMSGGLR